MDNLKGTFTAIAEAIRERGGTTERMTPAAMPERIRAIPKASGTESGSGSGSDSGSGTGGSSGSGTDTGQGSGTGSGSGGVRVAEKDVNFRDYDGLLVASFSFEEAAKLTALPEAPAHEGLIFQEWNRTLETVKKYAGLGLKTEAYAIYAPSDGKTRIGIWIMREMFRELWLFVCVKGGVLTIDWGDGTVDQVDWTNFNAAKSGKVNRYGHHKYAGIGAYTITVSGTAQVSLNADLYEVYGDYSASYGNVTCDPQSFLAVNAGTAASPEMQNAGEVIRSVVIGTNVRVCGGAFVGAKLDTLIIPKGTAFVNAVDAFSTGRGLPDVGIPSDVTVLDSVFRVGSISRIVIPEGVTQLTEAFDVARAKEVVVPASAVDLSRAFSYSWETCGNGSQPPNCRFIVLGEAVTVDSASFPEGCPVYVKDAVYETLKADDEWKTNYFGKGVVHKISELKG